MHRWFSLLPLLAGLAILGCGAEPSQTVSGVCTVDGKPLEGVILTFFTSNNKSVIADTDKDGKYSALIVGSGEVKVTAQVPPPRPKPRPDPPANYKGPGNDASKSDDLAKKSRISEVAPPSDVPSKLQLDPKYQNPETSGLSFKLTGSNITQNFTLTTLK